MIRARVHTRLALIMFHLPATDGCKNQPGIGTGSALAGKTKK
jgi:hypothetical protein